MKLKLDTHKVAYME